MKVLWKNEFELDVEEMLKACSVSSLGVLGLAALEKAVDRLLKTLSKTKLSQAVQFSIVRFKAELESARALIEEDSQKHQEILILTERLLGLFSQLVVELQTKEAKFQASKDYLILASSIGELLSHSEAQKARQKIVSKIGLQT